MSNVTLQIAGRAYTVACAEGEEAHVAALGAEIDRRITGIGGAAHNEGRQLLFAALILADELDEARKAAAPGHEPATAGADHAAVLEEIAQRLENCAAALER